MMRLPPKLLFATLCFLLSFLLGLMFVSALDHELMEIRTRLTALEARTAKVESRLDYLEATKEKMQLAPFEGHVESLPCVAPNLRFCFPRRAKPRNGHRSQR